MVQLLKAVHHLHDNWILHRDLKTSNLLLSHKGVLKVGVVCLYITSVRRLRQRDQTDQASFILFMVLVTSTP